MVPKAFFFRRCHGGRGVDPPSGLPDQPGSPAMHMPAAKNMPAPGLYGSTQNPMGVGWGGGRTLMGSDPHQASLNSPGRGEDMPRPPDRPRGRPGPDGHCAAGAPRPHPGPHPALQAVRGEDHRLPWCFGLVSPQCPPSPGFETRRCVGFRCGVSRRVFPPSWTGGVGPDPPPPTWPDIEPCPPPRNQIGFPDSHPSLLGALIRSRLLILFSGGGGGGLGIGGGLAGWRA